MTVKQQSNPAKTDAERRAAALRENLRKRQQQSRLRVAQSSRDEYVQAEMREAQGKEE